MGLPANAPNDGDFLVRGRKPTDNRQVVVDVPKPRPDAVWLLHSEFAAECTLSVVAEGKNPMFTLNRRQVFNLMAQCAEALRDMEPGK